MLGTVRAPSGSNAHHRLGFVHQTPARLQFNAAKHTLSTWGLAHAAPLLCCRRPHVRLVQPCAAAAKAAPKPKTNHDAAASAAAAAFLELGVDPLFAVRFACMGRGTLCAACIVERVAQCMLLRWPALHTVQSSCCSLAWHRLAHPCLHIAVAACRWPHIMCSFPVHLIDQLCFMLHTIESINGHSPSTQHTVAHAYRVPASIILPIGMDAVHVRFVLPAS